MKTEKVYLRKNVCPSKSGEIEVDLSSPGQHPGNVLEPLGKLWTLEPRSLVILCVFNIALRSELLHIQKSEIVD